MVNYLDRNSGQSNTGTRKRGDLAAHADGKQFVMEAGTAPRRRRNSLANSRIPHASKIYAGAAAALFVMAIYLMWVKGAMVTGFIVLVLAGVLFGYAVTYIRFQG